MPNSSGGLDRQIRGTQCNWKHATGHSLQSACMSEKLPRIFTRQITADSGLNGEISGVDYTK